jgi:hypothetical protein
MSLHSRESVRLRGHRAYNYLGACSVPQYQQDSQPPQAWIHSEPLSFIGLLIPHGFRTIINCFCDAYGEFVISLWQLKSSYLADLVEVLLILTAARDLPLSP